MLRFKSILSRIICLHLVAVVMTCIFMPAILYWLLESETNNLHRQSMGEHADTIAQHLVLHPDGSWTLDLPAGIRDVYSRDYGRYAYAILDDTGKVLFSTLDNSVALFPRDMDSVDAVTVQARHGEALMSGASVLKQFGDRSVWVQVGEDLAHRDVIIDDIVADFFKRVGWVTIPILAALLAIDIVIFRRALQPLVKASQEAGDISPERADVRLSSARIPREVTPLVLAVNQALDRLEKGLRVQREFTADAAHELRTPLAILQMRVETVADHRLGEELHRDVEAMCRIVSQLLAMAELEALVVDPLEKADLRLVCAEVIETIAPLALAQGKNVALSGVDGPVWVRGNQELLRTAIRNLVENAINHTPRDTGVEIVVEEDGRMSVLDEGPGIPAAERELIFQRFWRRDRRRSGNAGLGLAIVRRIVEAHGATITVLDRPTRGAQFVLSWVPAPVSATAGRVEGARSCQENGHTLSGTMLEGA